MTLPWIAHRVWLDEDVPEPYEENWRRFAELHPGWELRSWERSEDLDWMQNRALFEAFPPRKQTYAFRADVARYEILNRFGGCYLDTDVEPLKAFDPLLEDGRPFVAWCSDEELDPSIIASPPGHPAIRQLVEDLADVDPNASSPPGTTGPRYVTARWRHREDVLRLPPYTFFPFHWRNMDSDHGPWPERSYAVHHWAAGWKP